MAKFEPLDKTFFYFPDAKSIAMVTKEDVDDNGTAGRGAERLRISTFGQLRLGTPTVAGQDQSDRLEIIVQADKDANAFKVIDDKKRELFTINTVGDVRVTGVAEINGDAGIGTTPIASDKLRIKGKNNADSDFALRVLNGDGSALFSVRNDGKVSFDLRGLEIASGYGDWFFLRQSREVDGGGGFHIHNPWRSSDGDVYHARNRLEIGYRTPDGQERWQQFTIHAMTGNVGIGTGDPSSNKLHIKINDDSDNGLKISNNSSELFRVSRNGELHISHLENGSGDFVLYDGNKLVKYPLPLSSVVSAQSGLSEQTSSMVEKQEAKIKKLNTILNKSLKWITALEERVATLEARLPSSESESS